MAVHAAIIASLREQLNRTTAEPERLSLLCRLCRELSSARPVEALSEISDALRLAKRLNKREDEAWLFRLRGDCSASLDRMADARAAYRRSVELYTEIGEKEDAASIGIIYAETAIGSGAYVEGVTAYETVLELYRKEENYDGVIAVLKSLGYLHQELNDHARAFDYFLQGLKVAESLNDSVRIGEASSDLGLICVKLSRYDQAFYYFSRAVEEFRAARKPLLEVPTLVNLASLHAQQQNLQAALDYLVKAHVIYDLLGDKSGLATTFLNAGSLYERSHNPDSALSFYMKGLDLFDELGDNVGRGVALLGIGNVYRTIGRNHDAIWFLENALRAALETEDREREVQCRELLAHSLEAAGNPSDALRNLWKHLDLSRTLAGGEQQKLVAEMQTRFDLERAEKEREIWKLKSEQLEQEMNRKTAELTALTLQLVEKHRFIERLLEKLKGVKDNGSDRMTLIVQEVSGEIRKSATGGDDWKTFEEQFEKVHPDLMHRIASRWPELSPSELRTCALIVTGLSIDQIADLLCISKRGVETYRYRIRKRLGIDSKTNLATFLQGV